MPGGADDPFLLRPVQTAEVETKYLILLFEAIMSRGGLLHTNRNPEHLSNTEEQAVLQRDEVSPLC